MLMYFCFSYIYNCQNRCWNIQHLRVGEEVEVEHLIWPHLCQMLILVRNILFPTPHLLSLPHNSISSHHPHNLLLPCLISFHILELQCHGVIMVFHLLSTHQMLYHRVTNMFGKLFICQTNLLHTHSFRHRKDSIHRLLLHNTLSPFQLNRLAPAEEIVEKAYLAMNSVISEYCIYYFEFIICNYYTFKLIYIYISFVFDSFIPKSNPSSKLTKIWRARYTEPWIH